MKGGLATVQICVFSCWRFLNHFDIVWETPYSCDAVGWELRVASYTCSLLCPEMDWKIHVGKQGYVFILTDFKKRYFDYIISKRT